jgi:(1->4)-alpha-D-glucan 1-alpha-D-glucosylmutase
VTAPAPRATYRVQLRPGFGFDEAASLVPYLADLGVSHLYVSPVLQAVPGSEHGYDVADPTRISEDLGGDEALARLVGALRGAGLGLLVDIVPNHMSTDARFNPWWADVLEAGTASPHADFFDVDWEPPWPELRGRVLLPVLGDTPEAVAERGELGLEREGGRIRLAYFDTRVPLDPSTLSGLLAAAAGRAGAEALTPCVAAATAGFGAGEPGATARRRFWEDIGELGRQPAVAAAIDAELERIGADPASLLALCDRQPWLLAHWRDAATRLNHRRFFTITSLIGVRVEEPRVFEAGHRLVAELVREGAVDGLRVDHIDGLRDPADYLRRLRAATGAGWVVVEKILEEDERLPEGWDVDGTTGYELGALLAALSVDPAGEGPLSDLHAGITGHTESFEHCLRRARLEVLQGELASDVTRLTAILARVADDVALGRPCSEEELREALVAVLAEVPVYRAYVDPVDGRSSPEDAAVVGIAVARARRRLPGLRGDLLDLLADSLGGRVAGQGLELAARVQQLTPALMAKGKEDTALYRWNRLLALNEVGASPGRFGLGVDAFHAQCARWVGGREGLGLRATSTHDTKRSEDVRARLCVLSEIPERWAEAVRRWSTRNASRRPPEVDPDTEYVLYQTLVGAFPIDAGRLAAYIEKATREAGVHTSWTDPDPAYDAAVARFVRSRLADHGFVSDVAEFTAPLVGWGRRLSLAWTLLKVTVPGVPDVYQGTELWDLSLVDPDNRRPVDFDLRRRLLERTEGLTLAEAGAEADSGLPKLLVVRRALELRRRLEDAFAPGSAYTPLAVTGRHADRVVAFARGEPAAAVTVVDRRAVDPAGGWGDTALVLPTGRWEERLGGATGTGTALEGEVPLASLLGGGPVALLERS